MKLGKLGLQYCIKSQKAFNRIEYIDSIVADNAIYYNRKKARDDNARSEYLNELESGDLDGVFMRDIIREGMKNGDKRLRF